MSEENEPIIDGRPISDMKVVELKEELGKRGLSKIGNKNALHERLKEFLLSETSDAKDESQKQSGTSESPQRDLTSPPNPLVAEYLAKQQTALREARKDAEAVRRASSGDDASPAREKAATAVRRSRRGRQELAASDSTSTAVEEKLTGPVVTSETEQENVLTEYHRKEAEKEKDGSNASERVKERDNDSGSASEEGKAKIQEAERRETEYDGMEQNEAGQKRAEDSVSYGANVENKSEERDVQNEQASVRDERDAASDTADSGTDDNASNRSRSQSEATEESLEKVANQASEVDEQVKAVECASVEKIEVTEHTNETATVKTGTKVDVTSEKRRRWKPSAAVYSENSVVTVSITKHKQEKVEMHEQGDMPDTQSSDVPDFKEDLSDSKDKMEELDYEEPMQTSVAEVAEEVKAAEKSAEKNKTKSFERFSSEHSRGRKRSLTPDKRRESQTTVDGFVRERSVSPARYPVTQVIMIRQLTRPYTVKQLQQLLSTFGTIVEGGFWIDNIKSTCIAKYATVEEAVIARGRLHNIVWPPCSPKTLKVDYSDDANLEKHLTADLQPSEGKTRISAETRKLPSESTAPALRVSLSVDEKKRHVQSASQEESGKDLDKDRDERGKHAHEHRARKRSASPVTHLDAKRLRERRSPRRDERRRAAASPELKQKEPEKRVKTADELFLKTKTQPAIYYLPLTEEQIVERSKRKAVEAELAKKVAQNGATSKRKEQDEQAKEKTCASKHSSGKSPPPRRRSRTPPPRRRSRTPVAQRDRRHSRSRSPRRRR